MKLLNAVLVLLGAVLFSANAANLNVLGFKQPGEYLPIPSNANPFQPNQPDGLHISEIEDDVFFVSDTAYTFCMIDIGTSLLVIDAPPSVTSERLRAAVTTVGNKKKVSHFIYTHAHVDHVGLANSLRNKRKIKYVAHRLTAELLKRNPTAPTPSIIIEEDETKMTFGNKELEFYYYGNSHAEGNMLIWIPNSQVLICIDVVFPQWAPFYGLGVTQDAIRFMKQYEIILSFPFKHFITGHLGRTANRTDVVVALNFINDMKAIVTEGLKLFNNITAYYEKFGGNNPLAVNHWAVLHNWEGDMATHCAQTLIDNYQGIMAGIDVYSWSNCWILREHLALFTPVE